MRNLIFLSLTVAISVSGEEVNLGKVDVVGQKGAQNTQISSYSSSRQMSRQKLDTITSKNNTISEVLKTNPNVTLSLRQNSSTSVGEISPNDLSINGSSFYQNNFMVDGVTFSNDVNPVQYRNLYKNIWKGPTLGSQAINLDTDLLKSIEVLDSGISAKYGGFQGGVVSAKTRDPRPGFHGVTSFKYTNADWTKSFIDPLVQTNYKDGTGWMDRSNFSKRKYRFGMEGYVSEDLGILFDYTRNTSVIKNVTKPSIMNEKYAKFPNDERQAENYFLKAIWHASDRVTIKPSYLYSKQTNSTFIEHDLNSDMDAKFGGFIASIETDIDLDSVFLEQTLSYSEYESSRYFKFKDGLYAYRRSNLAPWGGYGTKNLSYYGGINDIVQDQKNFNYKLDATIKEFEGLGVEHRIKAGFEYLHQNGVYDVTSPFASYGKPAALPPGYICRPGDRTCLNDDSFGGAGQYLTYKEEYGNIRNEANLDKFALYFEDEMRYERLKVRPGVRLEYDSISKDFNIAPRFVTEYDILGDDTNFIGFGLNRYYGRNLFNYQIYNNMYAGYKEFSRKSPNDPFIQNNGSVNGWLKTDLKIPYDDEFSLFYRGDIDNARLNLKYIKRKSKDEIIIMSRNRLGLDPVAGIEPNYQVYRNDGKTSSDIITFSASNIEPIGIGGFNNDFEFAFTYMNKKRNHNDYLNSNIHDKALYDGKVVELSDLPVVDFYVPYSAKFSHTIALPQINTKVTNFVNYTGRSDMLLLGYDNAAKMRSYKKVTLPSHTTWDMRISYNQKLSGQLEFFSNLDINNILNKKYPISGGLVDGKRYYSYDSGRNFWLEVGLKW